MWTTPEYDVWRYPTAVSGGAKELFRSFCVLPWLSLSCAQPERPRSRLIGSLRMQRATLRAAGCDVIRAEKASGSRRDGRTELRVLLDFVQPGDTLIVTRIDRLARSMKDLQDIVHELKTLDSTSEIKHRMTRSA